MSVSRVWAFLHVQENLIIVYLYKMDSKERNIIRRVHKKGYQLKTTKIVGSQKKQRVELIDNIVNAD